jgi:hypothetical protein
MQSPEQLHLTGIRSFDSIVKSATKVSTCEQTVDFEVETTLAAPLPLTTADESKGTEDFSDIELPNSNSSAGAASKETVQNLIDENDGQTDFHTGSFTSNVAFDSDLNLSEDIDSDTEAMDAVILNSIEKETRPKKSVKFEFPEGKLEKDSASTASPECVPTEAPGKPISILKASKSLTTARSNTRSSPADCQASRKKVKKGVSTGSKATELGNIGNGDENSKPDGRRMRRPKVSSPLQSSSRGKIGSSGKSSVLAQRSALQNIDNVCRELYHSPCTPKGTQRRTWFDNSLGDSPRYPSSKSNYIDISPKIEYESTLFDLLDDLENAD